MSKIQNNLETIYQNMEMAAIESGRKLEDITLIAVTKNVDIIQINELISLGVNNLGENKAQEMLAKYNKTIGEPMWHFIGHLQTNKVKYIADKVQTIQSVDSERLAIEINKKAKQLSKEIEIFIEVNISGESTKYGIEPSKIYEFIEHICVLSNIRITGLMCMAPFLTNPEKNRVFFEKIYKLRIDINKKFYHNINIRNLSMGMTNDYIAAIKEGATMIRVGTAIFSDRAG